MFQSPKKPLDQWPHQKNSDSRPLQINEAPGYYVYVVDLDEVIHVAPGRPHMHPEVLGFAREALYAGDLLIQSTGVIDDVTNISGTFRFDSKKPLCCVVSKLIQLGFSVSRPMWHDFVGGGNPRQLKCHSAFGSTP